MSFVLFMVLTFRSHVCLKFYPFFFKGQKWDHVFTTPIADGGEDPETSDSQTNEQKLDPKNVQRRLALVWSSLTSVWTHIYSLDIRDPDIPEEEECNHHVHPQMMLMKPRVQKQKCVLLLLDEDVLLPSQKCAAHVDAWPLCTSHAGFYRQTITFTNWSTEVILQMIFLKQGPLQRKFFESVLGDERGWS